MNNLEGEKREKIEFTEKLLLCLRERELFFLVRAHSIRTLIDEY